MIRVDCGQFSSAMIDNTRFCRVGNTLSGLITCTTRTHGVPARDAAQTCDVLILQQERVAWFGQRYPRPTVVKVPGFVTFAGTLWGVKALRNVFSQGLSLPKIADIRIRVVWGNLWDF